MKHIPTLILGLTLATLAAPTLPGQEIRPQAPSKSETTRRAADSGEEEWARLQSPALGYYVRGRQVRLMLGVPGAAHLSDVFAAPQGLARVHAAPGHRWLLGLTKSEAFAWRPESGQTWPLADVNGLQDLLALSPSGAEAAFYKNGRLIIYGGLPENPHLLASLADFPLPEGARELALAPGGHSLAVAAAAGVFLLKPGADSAPELIDSGAHFAGLSFAPAGDRLLYLDPSASTLHAAVREAGAFLPSRLAGESEGLIKPERAIFDAQGQIWVASREAGALWKVDRDTGLLERFEAAAGALERLRIAGALLLTGSDEPATLVLAPGGDGPPGLSWVPAPTAEIEIGEVRQ